MYSVNNHKDPIDRMIRDCTPAEFVVWMVKYHGLPPSSAKTVESNLLEQFKWHRLQGRLDRSTTAGLVAQLLLMRQSVSKLERLKDE